MGGYESGGVALCRHIAGQLITEKHLAISIVTETVGILKVREVKNRYGGITIVNVLSFYLI